MKKNHVLVAIAVLILAVVFFADNNDYRLVNGTFKAKQWTEKRFDNPLCEKPPCAKESLADIMGPMRSDEEWRRFAEQGEKKAQDQQCSSHGNKADVDQDYYLKVVQWCHDSANTGDLGAIYLLGNLYAKGEGGLEQSWEDAYFWFALAPKNAERFHTRKDEIAQNLSQEQIISIEKRVEGWKNKLCSSKPTTRNELVRRDNHCLYNK